MKFISFGKCNYHVIYPLIFIFGISTINTLKDFIESKIQKKFFFIQTIGLMFFAEMVGGCLYFVDKYKKQTYQKQEDQMLHSTIPATKIFSGANKKYTMSIVILILGLGLLDLITSILNALSVKLSSQSALELLSTLISSQFLVYLLLSIIILHQQVYCHHYTSIGIFLFGFILTMIPLFGIHFRWESIILMVTKYILNAGLFVSDKWLMHFKRINPFFLLLLQGIAGFGFFCFMLILIFTLCPNDSWGSNLWYCNDIYFMSLLDSKGGYFLLVEFIKYVIVNICIVQTINHFTPLYYLSINVLANIIYWIINVIILKTTRFNYLTFFGYLITMFAFLIYNETIILHFWGLDFNTKKMITVRSQLNYIELDSDEIN